MNTVFYAIIISVACLAAGCTQKNFKAYHFDNGDDYFCEGLQRIVDENGRIGFADSAGKVVITPQYAFAFPFDDGVARATMTGRSVSDGEHSWWESQEWFYVNRNGSRVSELETALRDYVSDKDDRIGISIIRNGTDTIAVHGRDRFPMLSVNNNDVAYVNMPDGQRYSIAVFITGSSAGLTDTSAMIAEISEIVLKYHK